MNSQTGYRQNPEQLLAGIARGDRRSIARAISLVEDQAPEADAILSGLDPAAYEKTLILGITGPPGAGKSTLTNRLIGQLLRKLGKLGSDTNLLPAREGDDKSRTNNKLVSDPNFRAVPALEPGAVGSVQTGVLRVGVIAVDPSSPLSGGAILGDRIRMMEHAADPRVLVRSMASRGRGGGLAGAGGSVARIMAAAGCRTVIIETVGVGQAELDIVAMADLTLLIFAPGLGDDIQAMKAGLLELADLLVVNKADLPGASALALDLEAAVRGRRRGEKLGSDTNLLPAREGDEKSRTNNKLVSDPNFPNSPPIPAVVSTVAVSGQGVEQLVELIAARAEQLRTGGDQARRRQAARHQEIANWAVELLRPRLLAGLSENNGNLEGDPRRRAGELLARLGLGDEPESSGKE